MQGYLTERILMMLLEPIHLAIDTNSPLSRAALSQLASRYD